MTPEPVLTRRILLRDLGRAGLAFVVFGVAACTPGSRPGNSTSAPQEPAGSNGYQWARANLGFVSAYILYRAGEAVVVDTGVPGSVDAISAALGGIGLGWGQVGHVVITHEHTDHQGSLPEVLAEAPEADWYAGAGDIDAITAPRAGSIVGDGDRVLGLDILETPGHTLGHISVLDPVGGVLVAGDAVNGAGGGIVGANPQFSIDMSLANASIRKMAGFEYEVVLVGHGEPITSAGSVAMSALAESLE